MESEENLYLMKEEPDIFLNKSDLEKLLVHFYEIDGSDIYLMHRRRALAKVKGNNFYLTERDFSSDDMANIANLLYRSENAESMLLDIGRLDMAYDLKYEKEGKIKRVRFRVNITPTTYHGERVYQITIRLINSNPKSVKELGVEKEIVDNFSQSQGIVIITGPTGSGKSTLMAANIKHILENPETSIKIDEYSSPIEFIYDDLEWNRNFVSQTEIGPQIAHFYEGIEASLRRNPDIIVVGESRDKETISSSINASQTGHGVVTTAHTSGVSNTISRMVNIFSKEERDQKQRDLLESLRMVVSQRLIFGKDGGILPIKEWWIPTEEEVEKLYNVPQNDIANEIRKIIKNKQRTFYHDALRKYQKGLIDKKILDYVKEKY